MSLSVACDDFIGDGFVTVSRKKNRNQKISHINIRVNRDLIFEVVPDIMIKYGACASVLYGSTARGSHKPTSDVDIMGFWKIVPDSKDLDLLIAELKSSINKDVDLVIMEKKHKEVKIEKRDEAFISDVKADGVYIHNTTDFKAVSDLIDYSIKHGLYKPSLKYSTI